MRKKFTMLLAALLACVGAMHAEGLTVGQRYRLKNVASGLYMQNMGDNTNLKLQAEKYSVLQFFYLEEAEGGQYYLRTRHNGATRYVNASGWNGVVSSGKDTPYTISLVEGQTDVYTLNQTVSGYKGNLGVDGTNVGESLYCNKDTDTKCQWQFEAVEYPVAWTYDPEKTYRIKSEYSGLYMELVNPTQASGEGAFQFKNKSANAGQQFKFEAAEGEDAGKYYLKTVDGDNTYYVNASSWNFYAGADATTPFEIALVGDETAIYSLNQQVAAYTGFAGNTNDAVDGTKIYNNQGSLTKNTIWSFEEVKDVVVEITYIYKYGETELKRETVNAVVGAPYAINLPWGYATTLSGTVAEAGEITVDCTVDLPFEYAASIEEVTKWYYVQMKSNEKKFIQSVVNETENYIEWADAEKTEGETESYLWAFVGNIIDGFKMVNNATGTAIKSTGSGNPVLAAFDEATAWIPAQSDVAGDQYFCFQYPGGEYMNAQNGKVSHWDDNDQGSTFNVVEAETYTINYTYTYELDGNVHEVGTSSATVCVGCPYPAVSAPFGFATETPVGKVLADESRTLVCTDNLPFEYAATVEDIEYWYYMQMHSNNKMYIKRVENGLTWEDASVDEAAKGSYAWAFVGDPINGFKVVNFAAGVESALLSTGNNGDAVTLTVFADATPLFVKASSQNKVDFCLMPAGGHYLNATAGTVKHWGDPDAGSTIKVTEAVVTLDRELALLVEEYEALDIVGGVNPGEYSDATVQALDEAIALAKEVVVATEADIEALTNAYNALATNPVVAGLYRIVSAASAFTEAKGITCYAKDTYHGQRHYPGWANVNENDPLQYWVLEDAGEGKFNIKAAYEGNYLTTATSMTTEAKAAEFISLGRAQYNIKLSGDDKALHCNGWNWPGVTEAGLTKWDTGADEPSAWKLVAVTEEPEFTFDLNVSAAGYATLMLAYNATIPAGVTCNTVSVENGCAFLNAIEGNVLPAKTPVVVAAAPEKYTFASTTEAATVSAANELQGTLYPRLITPEVGTACYVLANKNNVVGLYKAALDESENTAFLNGANKVYLSATVETADAEAPAMFAFTRGEEGDDSTGIENVESDEELVIYDLAGRRVQKMEKGIYIVNGRKVVIK